MKKRILKLLLILMIILFAAIMLIFPKEARSGAYNGLVLCGQVVIPSLFPFTFCALMLIKIDISALFRPVDAIIKKVFRLNRAAFSVFLLSLISGYPVGARLVGELEQNGSIDKRTACLLYCCCTNAGPAFIITFIGRSVFSSSKAGYILLAAHLLPSLILLLLFRPFFSDPKSISKQREPISLSDIFVDCAAQSSASMLKICTFVILFSTLNQFLYRIIKLKPLTMLLEVTSGVLQTNNIYIIAFLTGFAGVSVWCQVRSSAGPSFKITVFIFSRIIHGILSSAVCMLLIKCFGLSFAAISTGKKINGVPFVDSVAVSVGLLFMTVLFIISLFGKSGGRKILSDVV